ncbi:hypothetical protein B0H13DRAFT_2278452 [Mycena leptocephala]|nr:hypothetical protein B0H13DRAFT_2278452 [Mycena leptocephala]
MVTAPSIHRWTSSNSGDGTMLWSLRRSEEGTLKAWRSWMTHCPKFDGKRRIIEGKGGICMAGCVGNLSGEVGSGINTPHLNRSRVRHPVKTDRAELDFDDEIHLFDMKMHRRAPVSASIPSRILPVATDLWTWQKDLIKLSLLGICYYLIRRAQPPPSLGFMPIINSRKMIGTSSITPKWSRFAQLIFSFVPHDDGGDSEQKDLLTWYPASHRLDIGRQSKWVHHGPSFPGYQLGNQPGCKLWETLGCTVPFM